jgi:hypothetical protein
MKLDIRKKASADLIGKSMPLVSVIVPRVLEKIIDEK